MSKFTEAKLEQVFIKLLADEGYPHYLGNCIDRANDEVLIEADLCDYLRQRYQAKGITKGEISSIISQLKNLSAADLINKFENHEDQQVCRSLISWINDGSHDIFDDLYIENQEGVSAKYLKVFENIFKFTNHEGHYKMMMQINT